MYQKVKYSSTCCNSVSRLPVICLSLPCFNNSALSTNSGNTVPLQISTRTSESSTNTKQCTETDLNEVCFNGCTVKRRKQMWKLKIRFLSGLFSCAALLSARWYADSTCQRWPPRSLFTSTPAKTAERRPCPDDQSKVSAHLSMRALKYGLLGLATNDNGQPGCSVSFTGYSFGVWSRLVMKPFWGITER